MSRSTRIVLLSSFLSSLLCAVATTQAGAVCVGDCGEDGTVTVDEVVRCADLALRSRDVEPCPMADTNGDRRIGIDELVQAVDNSLHGCSTPSIPTSAPELLAWLQAGNYLDWTHESARHVSAGPHARSVLTYLNDLLFDSLTAGNDSHPSGAAAVKELYNSNAQLVGWAVSVKTAEDSADGANWYWYEGAALSGLGLDICTGCHGDEYRGLPSRDYVLTPFPLQ